MHQRAKKNLFSSLVLISLSFWVHAQEPKQEEETKWNLQLNAGVSLPLSDFGNKEVDNLKSGIAITGFSSRLKGAYALHKGLFIEANVIWFYHPVDAKVVLSSLTEQNPPELKYKVTTYPWKVAGFLGGIGTGFSLDKDVDLELKALLGLVSGNYSKTIYQATDGRDTITIIESAASTLATALNLGFDLKYTVYKGLGISFSGDYFVTELNFNDVNQFDSRTNRSQSIGAYTQPLSAFQFGLGVFYKF
jgi:hypothetical protein